MIRRATRRHHEEERTDNTGLIKFDYIQLPNPAYIGRMREINGALNSNPNFPGQAAKLAEFTTRIGRLEAKTDSTAAAELLAKREPAERDAEREGLEEFVRGLASGCEAERPGDKAALGSGGWHLRSARAAVGPMSAPRNLIATGGTLEGEVDCYWATVKGWEAYIAE